MSNSKDMSPDVNEQLIACRMVIDKCNRHIETLRSALYCLWGGELADFLGTIAMPVACQKEWAEAYDTYSWYLETVANKQKLD